MGERITNTPASALKLGDEARMTRVLTSADIALFAAVSGDLNPAHLDPAYANDTRFHGVIAHGMWGAGLISALLGVKLPGPGTIYLGQTLKFRRPVRPGQTVEATVRVKSIDAGTRRAVFDCAVCAGGELAIAGEAEVLAPEEAISLPLPKRPDARLHERPARLAEFAVAAAGPDPEGRGAELGEAFLIDAPAADRLLLVVHGPEPAWAGLARAAGLDPAKAALAGPPALIRAAQPDGPHVLTCESGREAALIAESLDSLGGAAASAFRLTQTGPVARPGDDRGGVETAAARAIARLVHEGAAP